MKRGTERTLSRELILGLSAIVSISTILIAVAHLSFHIRETKRNFEIETRDSLEFLRRSLVQPLWQLDHETVEIISAAFLRNETAVAIRVKNEWGDVVSENPTPFRNPENARLETVPISRQGRGIGTLEISLASAPRRQALIHRVRDGLLTLLVTLLAILFVTRFFVERFFRRPMAELIARMEGIANGNFSRGDRSFRHREIVEVMETFGEMAKRVQERETSLAELNRTLKREIRHRERATEFLRESEQNWHDIVHFAPVGIYRAALDGRILLANPEMAKIFGYDSPKILMESVDSFERLYVDPEDRRRLVPRILAEGSLIDAEVRYRHASGREIWCSLSSRTTRLDGESILEGFVLDITARKRAEEALRESERFQAQIVDFLPDPTFVVDANNRVIAWNRALEELTGVEADAMLGKGDFEYAVPFYGERRPILIDLVRTWSEDTAAKYTYVRKKGLALISETRNPPFKPDDTCFWNAACPLFDENGRFAGAIETIRDISESKRFERSLRESEFRFRSFFDSSPDGVVIADLDGRLTDINRSLLRMTGFERDELAGRHFRDLTPETHHRTLRKAMESFRRGIAPDKPVEIEYFTRDGGCAPAIVRAWLVTDPESKAVGIGAFVQDISREKSLAREKETLEKQLQQTQKMEAIGTLAGGIAHDFNNILAGIIGYAELLQCKLGTDSPAIREYSDRILDAGNRARDIVRQILQFSREESGSHRPVEIRPVVREAVKLLQATLPSTIQVFESISVESETVLADPTRIHQVVMNLCTNAYQAMRGTDGVLIVGLEADELPEARQAGGMRIGPGPCLKLSVSDTGRGIEPSVLDRIFDPYFTTKQPDEGTGLGLSVTLGIVKSFKGLIEVESTPGVGTTFTVFLPAVHETETSAVASAADLPRGLGERILIVDDEAFFRETAAEHLKLLGYDIETTSGGFEALEMFRRDPIGFDLVLTDQSMPEMTGIQLCARLRELDPRIPIVLCTGYSDQVDERTAGNFGISRFLLKPVSRAALARAVSDVLHGPPSTETENAPIPECSTRCG